MAILTVGESSLIGERLQFSAKAGPEFNPCHLQLKGFSSEETLAHEPVSIGTDNVYVDQCGLALLYVQLSWCLCFRHPVLTLCKSKPSQKSIHQEKYQQGMLDAMQPNSLAMVAGIKEIASCKYKFKDYPNNTWVFFPRLQIPLAASTDCLESCLQSWLADSFQGLLSVKINVSEMVNCMAVIAYTSSRSCVEKHLQLPSFIPAVILLAPSPSPLSWSTASFPFEGMAEQSIRSVCSP